MTEIIYGCTVDNLDYEECVMDCKNGAVINDCSEAEILFTQGKPKTECVHWKCKIKETCKCCGQLITKE